MKLPPEFLDEVRAKVSLSGLIGRRVELTAKGREFVGLCPFHKEKTPSFTVVDDKGIFQCFGCGANGDVFAFVMRMEGIENFREGVKAVCADAGIAMPESDSKPDIGGEQKTKWTPFRVVPDDAPGPSFQHHRLGSPAPNGIWTYRNAEGRVMGYVCRFDKNDGSKEILPFVLCETQDGRKQWRWQSMPAPRSLFGLELLGTHPDRMVIVVEGEKTVEAARKLLPNNDVVTWPGGGNAFRKADFTPLFGKKVLFWPDADAPGMKAMNGFRDERNWFKGGVAQLLAGKLAGAQILKPPEGVEPGWDAADALAEGWTVESTAAYVAANHIDPDPGDVLEHDLPLDEAEAAALDRDLSTLHQSDTDNAKRLVARTDKNLIYVALDNWSTWDDKRYRGDVVEDRVTMAQTMAGKIESECQYLASSDAQEKRWKWSISSANQNKVAGCLAMARPMMTVRPEALDSDTWLINCEDGTLDLRTGHQRGVSKDDLITKLAPVVYDEAATCPAWDAFLCDIFSVNMDADDIGSDAAQLVAFMKRAVGYSICGDTSEHCMFILHGAGRNGKSTFLETLAFVLGDYASSTPADTFMMSDHNSSGRNDLARLRGARFVTSTESASGKRIDEALIKQATGGDTVVARFLFKEFFEYKPQFCLWLGTNHKPDVRGTDRAIWSRLVLIPFSETFYKADDESRPADARLIDTGIADALKLEAPGIMRWCVEGCLEWQQMGLRPPAIVKAAMSGYRAEQDTIGEFIEMCCKLSPNLKGLTGELYKSFVTWAESNGVASVTPKRFTMSMGDRGYSAGRFGGNRIYHGIDLTEEIRNSMQNSQKNWYDDDR